ncbi:peptide ABC transporter permease [Mycoplasma zalophi]|uniref:peptide ABC transporter permease n=1 Tax=Mycoplasma zalophi TaxID=191287 RepID=UPI0021C8E112|nr:peptide ABC transporter permease [Mycoplasma zalophi]MCU4117232.1 peptide ABC transporter permease [Mycoplasma zalophi]
MSNLFTFSTQQTQNTNSLFIPTNSFRLYWKRFFKLKINKILFVLFLVLLFTLIISTFFIKNNSFISIDENTNLVNNLPSVFSQEITKNFHRSTELDFIRNVAELDQKNALNEHRDVIFSIIFDSSKDVGGNQTIYTDIVTLKYNPYNLLKAINYLNDASINIPKGLYLGTNSQGIDIFSRIIVTLWITFLSIIFAIFINIFLAFNLALLVNLYPHNIIVKFIDKTLTSLTIIPEIIWIFLLSVFLGTYWYSLLFILTLVCWMSYYNLLKQEINILLNSEFIIAIKSIGVSNIRLAYSHIFKHVTPNLLILLVERFSINILMLSSLAFLDFLSETNNLNIGTVLREAITLFSENPSYLLIISVYIVLFSLILKLLSINLASAYNPKY